MTTTTGGWAERRTTALLLLVVANACWGSAWAVAKIATAELAPSLLAGLRITLATGLFWLVLFWQRSRTGNTVVAQSPASLPLTRREIVQMVGLGVAALGLSYLLIYSGLAMITASDGALMIIGEVIFTTLLAAWVARERLDRRKIGGVVLGSLGVVVLVLSGSNTSAAGGIQRLIGNVMVLAGLFVQASYSVLGAGMSRRSDPATTMAIVYSGGLIIWVPTLIWYASQGALVAVSPTTILSVIYLAAIPSVACNLIWFAVLHFHGASLGAVSLFVQPIIGALLGVVLLGDPVTGGFLAGGALILVALGLLVLEPRRSTAPADTSVS
ncbi:MAG: DMT family transporter [Roseiflexaceae bacterium]